MTNIATVRYEADSSQVKAATKDLKNQTQASKGLEAANDKMNKASNRVANAQGKMANATSKAGRDIKAANDNIARSTGRMTKGFSEMKLVALAAFAAIAAAALGAVRGLTAFISGTAEAEKVQAQLSAALKSTGGAAGQSLSSLNAHAAALQRVTLYGDETTNQAQAMLLTFTKIQGETFPRATTATLDLATAMKTDLKSAAIQVGKALNDPVLGMTALSRSGIQFTDAQKEIVKQMVKTGNVAGAQNLILKELETQFGGSAAAARGTLGGALTALKNAFGDLFEVSGPGSEALRQSVEGLIKAISDPRFSRTIQDIGSILFKVLSGGVDIINKLSATIIFMRGSTYELELAIDNLTRTMGDEIKQVQILGTLLSKQEIMTLSAAKTKLEEAEARRTNIQAMIQENLQLVKSSDAYRSTVEHINNARVALNAMAPAGSDADQVPLRMRDAYEEMQKSLSQSLKTQREMLSVTTDGNIALSDNAKNIERLKTGIENAKNGMVRLNGEWVEGVGLSDRLNSSTNNVSNSLAGAANNANTLAGGLANATGYAANLSSFLGGIPNALVNSQSRIAGLTAGISALASGQGQAVAEVAKYRKELEASLPPLGSMQDGQRAFVKSAVDEKVRLFAEEKNLNKAYQDRISKLNKVSGSFKAIKSGATKAAQSATSAAAAVRSIYADAVKSTRGDINNFEFEATLTGLPDAQVSKLRKEQELLNAALQDGKQLTPELRGTISGLADEYSVAEQNVNSLTAANDNYLDAVEAGKGITKEFFSSFIDGIRNGESVWDSLKNSALNALNSIADKLLDMALNNLVGNAFGGGQTGGGGFLSGIFGSLFGGGGGAIIPGLFASGGYTGNGAVSAAAGIVHGQEFVNNAASTAKYRPHLEAMNQGNWQPPVMPVPVAVNGNSQRPMPPQRLDIHVTGRLVDEGGQVAGLIDEKVQAGEQRSVDTSVRHMKGQAGTMQTQVQKFGRAF